MSDKALELLETIDDSDEYLVIDNDLRTITVPTSLNNIGVYSDDSVKRLKFKMPRMSDDTDLSEFEVYINYLNAKGDGDKYIVQDMEILDDEITFSWLIGRRAFVKQGNVVFNVCLRKYASDNSTVIKEFNTSPTTQQVLEGLETDTAVVTDYTDIVNQLISDWEARFSSSAENVSTTLSASEDKVNSAIQDLKDLQTVVATEYHSPLWGIHFKSTTGSNTSDVEYLYDAQTYTKPTFASLTQEGSYPFDEAEPWQFTEFLIDYNDDGTWYSIGFKRMDGTKSNNYDDDKNDYDHMLRFKNAYFYRNDDEGMYVVSSTPRDGFSPFKTGVDGSVPEYIWIPVYKMSQSLGPVGANTGLGYSRPEQFVYWNNFQNHGIVAKNTSVKATIGSSWYENWKQIMSYIELGSRDVQNATDINGAKLQGFSSGIYSQTSCKVSEAATDVNTITVTNASMFVVGQTVNICTGWITSDKVGYRIVESIDTTANTLTLSGDPFSVEVDQSVYNMDWMTGHTDDILGHTGARVLSSGKYGMRYRGIEDMWGGSREDICDLRLTLVDSSDTSSNYHVRYCKDLIHARDTGDTPDKNFVDTGIVVTHKNGYIKRYESSNEYPELSMAVEVGGSSTTYFSDYMWFTTANNRAVRSGNRWDGGSNVGVAARICYDAASYSSRSVCARLFLEP